MTCSVTCRNSASVTHLHRPPVIYRRRSAQLTWVHGWLDSRAVAHPSTNRARCKATSLIETIVYLRRFKDGLKTDCRKISWIWSPPPVWWYTSVLRALSDLHEEAITVLYHNTICTKMHATSRYFEQDIDGVSSTQYFAGSAPPHSGIDTPAAKPPRRVILLTSWLSCCYGSGHEVNQDEGRVGSGFTSIPVPCAVCTNPRRRCSTATRLLRSHCQTMCICVYVCVGVYVSTVKRKTLIAMTWNTAQ